MRLNYEIYIFKWFQIYKVSHYSMKTYCLCMLMLWLFNIVLQYSFLYTIFMLVIFVLKKLSRGDLVSEKM